MSEDCAAIINRLIEERHKKGLTQQELANKAHLTQSVVARFESKKAVPRIDTVAGIAFALDCSLVVVPMSQE